MSALLEREDEADASTLPVWLLGLWHVSEWLSDDVAGDSYRATLSLRERTRRERELKRVKELNAPWHVPGPDKDTKRFLREARDARIQSALAREAGDMPGAAVAMATAYDLEARAHARMAARRDDRWASAALAERATLEALRGETLVGEVTEVDDWVRDDYGAVVMSDTGLPVLGREKVRTLRSRAASGIAQAFENGDLDPQKDEPRISAERLRETAKAYRTAYETYATLATPERDPGAPAAQRCKPSAGPQEAAFAAGETLRLLRGIARHDEPLTRLSKLQVQVLDLVCGEDRTCSAAATALHRDHRLVKKELRAGLSAATMNTTMG